MRPGGARCWRPGRYWRQRRSTAAAPPEITCCAWRTATGSAAAALTVTLLVAPATALAGSYDVVACKGGADNSWAQSADPEKDVTPWLRKLGVRAEQARRIAASCEALPSETSLEERVRFAVRQLAPPHRHAAPSRSTAA